MINTEIFKSEHENNYTCFEEGLKMLNDLIKEKEIAKDDILEYRTENWEDGGVYHFKIIFSWWQ